MGGFGRDARQNLNSKLCFTIAELRFKVSHGHGGAVALRTKGDMFNLS